MLAVIPARGGSKGLPGKNIRPLNGLPLIAHSIRAARASRYITKVIVSTDSSEIYDMAMAHGADNSFLRPAPLATDDAKVIDTYLYTLDNFESELGLKYEELVVLQPTSPLRTSEDIDGAIDLFRRNSADSVITYTEEHHPIMWHKYLRPDMTLESIFPETLDNRQEHRRSYYPNGAVYVFKRSLLQKKIYTSDKTFAYIMPRSRSVDIDTIEDFEYASFLMKESK